MKHKNHKITRIAICFILAAVVFTGCQPATTPSGGQPPSASFMEERLTGMEGTHLEYYQKYIEPYSSFGIFTLEYNGGYFYNDNPQDGEGLLKGKNILDIIGQEQLAQLVEEHGQTIPGDVAEEAMRTFYPFEDVNFLRTYGDANYDAAAHTYTLNREIDAAPLYYEVVTGFYPEQVAVGDWLTVYADGYNAATDQIAYRHSFTVELLADDGFSALINNVQPLGDDGTPYIEWKGDVRSYMLYDGTSKTYTIKPMAFTDAPYTIGQLFTDVAKELGQDFRFHSIRLDKSLLTIDLPQEYLGEIDTAKERLLNSLLITLMENSYSADSAVLLADGQPHDGADGYYVPAPINLGSFTGEEYTRLRQEIPYERSSWIEDFLAYSTDAIIAEDETGTMLAKQLMLIGYPEKEIQTPADFTENHKIERALQLANLYSANNYNDELSKPELRPIAIEVEDEQMTLKEHVEEAVKDIFGPATTVQHQTVGKWIWHENAGVYTPPHMGGAAATMVSVLDYQDQGDRYTVTFVYYFSGMGGYLDEAFNELPANQLADYVAGKGTRWTAVFSKTEGDTLSVQSIVKAQ